MSDRDGQQIETDADARANGKTFVQLWLDKIERAEEDEEDWHEEGEKAIEIYEADDNKTSFNILHSNIETLGPALYNSSPIPDVRRRYGDADPVAKLVVDMTERALSYLIDQYDFDAEIIAAIKDATVPGRGTMRVRFETEIIEQIDPMTGAPVEVTGPQKLTAERVAWDKWGRGPARSWPDVPFIWFEHDLSREELVKLNPEIGATIGLEKEEKEDDSKGADSGIYKTVPVYEIWDKTSRSVIFITKKHKDAPLKVEPDPLGLEGFFPVPPPLQQIYRVSSLTPVCPYTVYRPLIEELDVITKRIRKLVGQLKVRGLIDAALRTDMDALRSLDDGQYIAATDAGHLTTSGGGLEKGIAHMPLDPTVKALQQLYIQREQIKQTIYEVTGLSDILRGASKETETATAQNLKAQWGSLRIQQMQAAVGRLARDIFRLKVEIMAKHYTPENLLSMTNLPDPAKPEQQQIIEPAIQLFKGQQRSFRIDIETDSTIRADMMRSQEQMNLFLAGTGQFAQAMTGVVQLAPEMLPVITEVYTAFARKFKLGKQAEDALDGLSQMAPQMAAKAAQQSQEDPEAKKREAEIAIMREGAQIDREKAAGEMQMKQQEHGLKLAGIQADLQASQMKNDLDAASRQDQLRADMMRNRMPQNSGAR